MLQTYWEIFATVKINDQDKENYYIVSDEVDHNKNHRKIFTSSLKLSSAGFWNKDKNMVKGRNMNLVATAANINNHRDRSSDIFFLSEIFICGNILTIFMQRKGRTKHHIFMISDTHLEDVFKCSWNCFHFSFWGRRQIFLFRIWKYFFFIWKRWQ